MANGMRKKLGDLADGVQTHAFKFHLSEEGDRFEERYRSKFGESPKVYSSYLGYDMVELVKEASKGREPTGEKIKEGLEEMKSFQGLSGESKVQKNGEINPPLVPVEIVNGSLQRVE